MLNPGDIVVITVLEENPKTHRNEIVVSHGIDYSTGKNVVMSGDRPQDIGAVFIQDLGEWVLRADPNETKLDRAREALPKPNPSSTLFKPSAPAADTIPKGLVATVADADAGSQAPAKKGFRNLGRR